MRLSISPKQYSKEKGVSNHGGFFVCYQKWHDGVWEISRDAIDICRESVVVYMIFSRWAGDDNEFPNDAEIDRP
jgi:hypothetical protein